MAMTSFNFCGYKIVPLRHGKAITATKFFREYKHGHSLIVTGRDHVLAYSDSDVFKYAFPNLNSRHARLAQMIDKAGLGNDATAKYLEDYEAKKKRENHTENVRSFTERAGLLGIKLTAEQRKALR